MPVLLAFFSTCTNDRGESWIDVFLSRRGESEAHCQRVGAEMAIKVNAWVRKTYPDAVVIWNHQQYGYERPYWR